MFISLCVSQFHLDDNYKILHNQKPTENQQKLKIVESLPLEEKSLKFDGDKKINFSPKLKLCSLTVHNGRCNNCDMFEANAKKHLEAAIKKKRQFDDMHLNAGTDDNGDGEDGWTDQEEEDDGDDSCSDATTASSRGSTPTPRSSPKRSPLLSKKVRNWVVLLTFYLSIRLLDEFTAINLPPSLLISTIFRTKN